MYEVSEAFHRQYADMYDKFVRIHFKDGSVRTGLFNDEFYDDSSILVSCEVIKITDIDRMELRPPDLRKRQMSRFDKRPSGVSTTRRARRG